MTVMYCCSGRSAARQDTCEFITDNAAEAQDHFEQYDHDVDEIEAEVS